MQFSRQLPHRDTVAALSRLPFVSRLDLLFRPNASRRFALSQGVQQRSLPFPVHNVRHTDTSSNLAVSSDPVPLSSGVPQGLQPPTSPHLTSPHFLNSARQRMEIGTRSWDFSPGSVRISRVKSALSSRSGASVRLPKARTRRSSWVGGFAQHEARVTTRTMRATREWQQWRCVCPTGVLYFVGRSRTRNTLELLPDVVQLQYASSERTCLRPLLERTHLSDR